MVAGVSDKDRWGVMMRAALAGDGAVYRVLLRELAGAMRSTVRAALSRHGHGNADVEDIVQEILIAVHLKRHNWNRALPFAPWVNAIARYKVIDCLRRRGLRVQSSVDDLANMLPAPANDAGDFGDIERLVRQLGERPQRIVRAVAMQQRSIADVAADLGMTEGAVRVALHRALKELARLYRKGER